LTAKPNRSDLVILKDLIEAGKIVPFIDRTYNLSDVPAAISQLEQRHVRGKVAISVL
jgi:NADPH:quinone reductase-like Zn-dependent oxidoreductase